MVGASAKYQPRVYVTVDVEPDCPPYLWTWRGIEEGMPRLLDLFKDEAITGTFFVTGKTAEKFPGCVEAILSDGHEIGNHGLTHNSFAEMDRETAVSEITATNDILRKFSDIVSFRAPYLSLPVEYEPILVDNGFKFDASRARYKFWRPNVSASPGLISLPASVTSSVLRLPKVVRETWFARLKDPVTLFVHPWEFVDLTKSSIRLDCRFRTGQPALDDLRETIRFFKRRNARFVQVRSHQVDCATAS